MLKEWLKMIKKLIGIGNMAHIVRNNEYEMWYKS